MDDEAIAAGFVFVDEVCPSIQQTLRYVTTENFLGTVVHGYQGGRAIITAAAAQALSKAQERFEQDGYGIVIYDTYRPQKSVDHFAAWSNDPNDTLRQADYYPRIDKARVFDLGYVAARSGHSRGSTVDLTIIPLGQAPFFPPARQSRSFVSETSTDTSSIHLPYLHDGTADMGTSFDLMDVASHYLCPFIPEDARNLRLYLREVMTACGFRPYDEEWWHFTLVDEPYPDTYFDFDVR